MAPSDARFDVPEYLLANVVSEALEKQGLEVFEEDQPSESDDNPPSGDNDDHKQCFYFAFSSIL